VNGQTIASGRAVVNDCSDISGCISLNGSQSALESTLNPDGCGHIGPVEAMHREDLLEKLRRFLEVHAKAKILTSDPGTLTMYVLHSKTQDKTTKQKMMNYKLLRLKEILLDQKEPNIRDRYVCEFLLEELYKYYKELN
tara:strand:+ start:135 stop:551 length:417 start_codon:yes stop_codon:yes gene_type:complete